MTLKEFWNLPNSPDGYYAVWVLGNINSGKKSYVGFSGDVVWYDDNKGFKNSPDWMDEFSESEINILFLQEL